MREYSTIRAAGRELFDSHKMSIRFTPTNKLDVWGRMGKTCLDKE